MCCARPKASLQKHASGGETEKQEACRGRNLRLFYFFKGKRHADRSETLTDYRQRAAQRAEKRKLGKREYKGYIYQDSWTLASHK